MWRYAAGRGNLLAQDVDPDVVRLIGRLWLYPPLVIVLTMPLGFVNMYPVYALWLLMPIASYAYSVWAFRRYRTERPDPASGPRPRGGKRTARDQSRCRPLLCLRPLARRRPVFWIFSLSENHGKIARSHLSLTIQVETLTGGEK
jgi:hypothetical protein